MKPEARMRIFIAIRNGKRELIGNIFPLKKIAAGKVLLLAFLNEHNDQHPFQGFG